MFGNTYVVSNFRSGNVSTQKSMESYVLNKVESSYVDDGGKFSCVEGSDEREEGLEDCIADHIGEKVGCR